MNDSEAEFKQPLLRGSTLILQLSADHDHCCGEEIRCCPVHPCPTFMLLCRNCIWVSGVLDFAKQRRVSPTL